MVAGVWWWCWNMAIGTSVIKRPNSIEFGLVWLVLTSTLVLDSNQCLMMELEDGHRNSIIKPKLHGVVSFNHRVPMAILQCHHQTLEYHLAPKYSARQIIRDYTRWGFQWWGYRFCYQYSTILFKNRLIQLLHHGTGTSSTGRYQCDTGTIPRPVEPVPKNTGISSPDLRYLPTTPSPTVLSYSVIR